MAGRQRDTIASAGFRFAAELIAWIAGPWAVAVHVSPVAAVPVLIVLVALPAVFSTPGDKRQVLVPVPGRVRIPIELLLYTVAAVAPWFAWSDWAGWACLAVVAAGLGFGIPRFRWLRER
ncbi:hypothetical protein [Maricaulis sp.]|uniref:hypothetical protein n=1 Tax=Maricaulis sp. TaxID=1486257 RepID=UPI0026294A13|nr:hypothetical protein [Maricaulis sp.]